MVKTYYRSEYSDKQWKALIDKAAELGCQVTYGRYGDRVEIDLTDRENTVLQSTNKSVDDCAARSFWAEHIHQMLQESTDLRRWKVQPKRIYNRVMDDRSGVCPLGELLTDKELERMRLYNSRRDWPNTAKVTVKTGEIYFSFGVRFAESYELIKPRE